MKTTQETVLPLFTGFYGTVFDLYEDWYECEHDHLVNHEGMSEGEAGNKLDACDIRPAHLAVAQGLADGFESLFNSHFDTKIKITFDSLDSPREYNFANDRIFCNIEYDKREIVKLVNDNRQEFSEFLKEHFTSCDGFSSHYSNDIDEWDIEEMQDFCANETWTIFQFLCEHECLTSMDLFYECNLMEDFMDGVDYEPTS